MDKNIKFRLIYCISLAAVTALLSVAAYHLGSAYSIHSKASFLLKKEISEIKNENQKISSEKEMLEKQKNTLNSQLEEKSHLNKELETSLKEADKIKSDIKTASAESEKLDTELEEKQEQLDKLKKVENAKTPKRLSVKEGSYSCPENIPEGRYIVSGSNTILLYSSSNQLRLTEDLSRLDGHTFTFDIAGGEKLRVVSNTVTHEN